jgi:hypothetical protein
LQILLHSLRNTNSIPKETSNKQMKEVKDVVASLVAVGAGIIDDRLMLMDEYLEEEDVPVDPSVSP